MNGRRYLLDTNAIIQLLKGNGEILSVLAEAEFVSTSIIAEMEFFSFKDLPEVDKILYERFRSRIFVYGVPSEDVDFTRNVAEIRKAYGLKLPDAIIAGTARVNELTILTADDHFCRLPSPWDVQTYTVNAGL